MADLYFMHIVGCCMADRITSRLEIGALDMAIQSRIPEEGTLAHSNWGSQFVIDNYQSLLEKHGIQCNMTVLANVGITPRWKASLLH